jgi:DNA-binding CsgD family transcriptional regulator
MSILHEQPYVSPILAGRADELSALQGWIQRAYAGAGQVMLISGEAGIGKSRLIGEARAFARERSFTVLQGNCFEPDRTLPFAPFLDLLRQIDLDRLAEARPLMQQLLKLAPELAAQFPDLSPAPVAEPELEKRLLLQAWLSLLIGPGAAPAPELTRLVIIEDLHWCDELSLEVLLQLARLIRTRPVAVLLSYRSEETPAGLTRLLAQLDRERLASELLLAPLTPAHVEAIVRAIFRQTHSVSTEFVAALYAHTEGNPFFLEEALKSLVAAGDIVFANGYWDRKRISELRVPRTVQLAVTQRASQLSPDAQRVLTLAAVAGRRFDSALLSVITQLSEPVLIAASKELLRAQLVIEESAETFAFRHALTQQAVYGALLLHERKALHGAVAVALEQAGPPALDTHLGDLSWHFYQSGVWDKALDYSQRAGERAQALYSPRAAAEYYTRAIVAAQAQSAGETLRMLQYARAEAYAQLGEFDAARSDYEAALVSAQVSGERQAEWQALLGLGFLWASRDYVQAGAFFQRALDLAPQLADAALVGHTLNRVGNWHMNAERPLEAIRYHSEAARLFAQLDDQRGRASTLDLLGISHYVAGDFARSIELYREAVALFRAAQDRGGIMTALMIGSSRGTALISRTVAPTRSTLAERVRDCEEGLQIAAAIGARPAEALGHAWLGLNYAMAGRYAPAIEQLRRGLAIAEQIEHRHFVCTAQMLLGVVHWDVSAWPLARTHLEQALELARETQSAVWQHHTAAFLVSALLQLGELPKAGAVLRAEWSEQASMNSIGLRQLWGARAELLLAQGEPAQALEVIERLVASAPNGAADGGQAIPYLALLAGEALLATNRAREALRRIEPALATAQAAELPALEWRLGMLQGRALLAHGRRDDAAAAFAQARQLVGTLAADTGDDALSSALLKAGTAAARRVALESPRRKAKAAFDGLTARERAVAAQIALGRSNREIATSLVVSERTVESHIANILGKLGATSRAQIAVWAVNKGLAAAE